MTKLIALDDGHGMATAGKRTPIFKDGTKSSETGKNFMHENEFNRAVGKYLEAHLKRCGFKVLQVAPTNADDSLSSRVARANNAKADLYVSIHANASQGVWGTWGGTETYTYGSGQSLIIGRIIHKHLMKGTPLRDRGVKNGNYLYVIKNTRMPSVLLECAFMDNLEEAKLLLSDDFRRECAREVAMGICEAYNVKFVSEVSTQSTDSSQIYRVRLNWTDAKTQIGAYKNLDSAKDLADDKEGYKVFDEKGNVVYDPKPVKSDPVWYRVRKTWADAKGQIGAFHDVNSAKELADSKAEDGYKVFDSQGKVTYTPKVEEPKPTVEPEVSEPKPEPKPVVDPHEGHTDILGQAKVLSVDKMVAFVKNKFEHATDIEEIAKQFIEVGQKYGIRGDIAFCQSIIETGWFKFDGGTAVTPDQHNYCGLGVTSKGMKGHSFDTVEEGVTAQIQHLFAYATKNSLPSGEFVIDPRFKYVNRGIAPHWEDLSNRWAMNANYGTHILSLYEQLDGFEYIPPKEDEVVVEDNKEEEIIKPEDSKINEVNSQQWKSIVDYIFKKLSEFFGRK